MDEKKRQVWRFVIQTAISILTAIATALGVTSCMAAVYPRQSMGLIARKKFPPLRRESRRGNDFLDDCFLDYSFLDLLTGG